MSNGIAASGEFTPTAGNPDIDRFCFSAACPLHVPMQPGQARAKTEDGWPFSPRTNAVDGVIGFDRRTTLLGVGGGAR